MLILECLICVIIIIISWWVLCWAMKFTKSHIYLDFPLLNNQRAYFYFDGKTVEICFYEIKN